MKKSILVFMMLCGLYACVNNTLQDQKVIEDSLKTSLNKYLHQNIESSIEKTVNNIKPEKEKINLFSRA